MFLIEIYNLFNRFNVFFNILKNININSLRKYFNELIEYMLHPMGGTPEPLKKDFTKLSDVNYRTSEGEPSRPTVPRPVFAALDYPAAFEAYLAGAAPSLPVDPLHSTRRPCESKIGADTADSPGTTVP